MSVNNSLTLAPLKNSKLQTNPKTPKNEDLTKIYDFINRNSHVALDNQAK